MTRQIEPTNRYADILLKLIPTEIIGAYMVIDGFISPSLANARWIALGASSFLLVMTPLYLRKWYNVQRRTQLIFMSLSFVVWVYWMGGPFKLWGIHIPQIASIILVLWTLLIPFFNQPTLAKGQEVQIVTKKPMIVTSNEAAVIWDEDMDEYFGKKARITRYDRKKQIVELDIDHGKYKWSVEWIRLPTSNGDNK